MDEVCAHCRVPLFPPKPVSIGEQEDLDWPKDKIRLAPPENMAWSKQSPQIFSKLRFLAVFKQSNGYSSYEFKSIRGQLSGTGSGDTL